MAFSFNPVTFLFSPVAVAVKNAMFKYKQNPVIFKVLCLGKRPEYF